MWASHTGYSEVLRWGFSIGIPALSGLIGVVIGAWLSGRRETRQRRYAFIGKQLNECYSPLLGLRSEIQMLGKLRVRIQNVAEREWRSICDKYKDVAAQGEVTKYLDERGKEFDKIIKYDNQQLAEELMPAYRQMVKIFRDNMWLADPETQAYFPKLLEFVEIWERWLAGTLPREVSKALEHDEKSLYPFYAHLQDKHDELRKKIAEEIA